VQMEDGSVVPPTAGTHQGGVVSPLLANLFLQLESKTLQFHVSLYTACPANLSIWREKQITGSAGILRQLIAILTVQRTSSIVCVPGIEKHYCHATGALAAIEDEIG